MNYLQETRAPDEEVVGTANFSWLFLALSMAPFWIGLLIVFVAFELLVRSYGMKYVSPSYIDYGILVLLALGIWRYLSVAMPWVFTEIAVTNKRIVYRHGFFTKQVEEVAINRIEGVNLTQPILGRLFGFGSLIIHGVGVDEVKLPPIADPMHFRKAIQEAIAESQSPDASYNS